MKYIISLVSILFLFSCENNSNPQIVKQIDQISDQLEDALAAYNKIDSIEVSNIRRKVKSNCLRIVDSKDPIVTTTFIPYSHIDKSMKQIMRMDGRIKKEVNISKSQLKDLRYDAKNDNVDKELLEIYFAEEKDIILKLIDRMEYNTQQVILETTRYDSLNPIIENYLANQN